MEKNDPLLDLAYNIISIDLTNLENELSKYSFQTLKELLAKVTLIKDSTIKEIITRV